MKRLLISASLIVFCLIMCIIENIYIKNTFNSLNNHISIINSAFENNAETTNRINDCQKAWKKHRAWLSLFVNHTTLDSINDELENLEYETLSNDNPYKVQQSLNKIIYLIENIKETERFGIIGLF